MTVWIAMAAVGAASYLLRLAPMIAGERIQLPERAEVALRHAGMGALTALMVLSIVEIAGAWLTVG